MDSRGVVMLVLEHDCDIGKYYDEDLASCVSCPAGQFKECLVHMSCVQWALILLVRAGHLGALA